jgi:hypothetical protein
MSCSGSHESRRRGGLYRRVVACTGKVELLVVNSASWIGGESTDPWLTCSNEFVARCNKLVDLAATTRATTLGEDRA